MVYCEFLNKSHITSSKTLETAPADEAETTGLEKLQTGHFSWFLEA